MQLLASSWGDRLKTSETEVLGRPKKERVVEWRKISKKKLYNSTNCCWGDQIKRYYMASSRKNTVFWDMTTCSSLVHVYQHSFLHDTVNGAIYVYGCSALVGLGRIFSFLILYTDGKTPWTSDQPVARPLPIHRTAQTQTNPTQTSMPWVGFESTIPVFEWAPLWSTVETSRGCHFLHTAQEVMLILAWSSKLDLGSDTYPPHATVTVPWLGPLEVEGSISSVKLMIILLWLGVQVFVKSRYMEWKTHCRWDTRHLERCSYSLTIISYILLCITSSLIFCINLQYIQRVKINYLCEYYFLISKLVPIQSKDSALLTTFYINYRLYIVDISSVLLCKIYAYMFIWTKTAVVKFSHHFL
jgi:hypothetical protein